MPETHGSVAVETRFLGKLGMMVTRNADTRGKRASTECSPASAFPSTAASPGMAQPFVSCLG